MDAWRADPDWEEVPPIITVNHNKGSTLNTTELSCVVALPPDAVLDILCDPNNHRVFRSMKRMKARRVVEDTAERQVVELEQTTVVSVFFLNLSFSVSLRVVRDRNQCTVTQELLKPGSMKKFCSKWTAGPLPVPSSQEMPRAGSAAFPTLADFCAIPVPALPDSNEMCELAEIAGSEALVGLPRTASNDGSSSGSGRNSLSDLAMDGGSREDESVNPVDDFPQLIAPQDFSQAELLSHPGLATSPNQECGDSKGQGSSTSSGLEDARKGISSMSFQRIATELTLRQEVQPAIRHAPAVDKHMRGVTLRMMHEFIRDLQLEAARLRYGLPQGCDVEAEVERKRMGIAGVPGYWLTMKKRGRKGRAPGMSPDTKAGQMLDSGMKLPWHSARGLLGGRAVAASKFMVR